MTNVVRLQGGVGNQLFQLAFARTKTILHDSRCVIDTSYSQLSESRKPLRFLRGNDDFYALGDELEFISKKRKLSYLVKRNPRELVLIKNRNSGEIKFLSLQSEQYRQFVYSFLLENEGYFVGSFLSHLYWQDNESGDVVNWLYEMVKRSVEVSKECVPMGVGIHARRGDYLYNKKAREFHGYLNTDYYIEAVERISDLGLTKDGILIESDDFQYASLLAKVLHKYSHKVIASNSLDPYQSLLNLSGCRATIGSNSTFSFWASYFQPKEVRIFPASWFITNKIRFSADLFFPEAPTLIENVLQS